MNTLKQFVHFSGVGVIGTLGHYMVLFVLVELARFAAVVSSGAGFTVGAIINYYLNRRFTFKSATPHRTGLPKFFVVALVGLGLNVVVMFAMSNRFSMHYLVAQLAATGIVLFWNFSANRVWTFREQS